jgi:hypothetical protein
MERHDCPLLSVFLCWGAVNLFPVPPFFLWWMMWCLASISVLRVWRGGAGLNLGSERGHSPLHLPMRVLPHRWWVAVCMAQWVCGRSWRAGK